MISPRPGPLLTAAAVTVSGLRLWMRELQALANHICGDTGGSLPPNTSKWNRIVRLHHAELARQAAAEPPGDCPVDQCHHRHQDRAERRPLRRQQTAIQKASPSAAGKRPPSTSPATTFNRRHRSIFADFDVADLLRRRRRRRSTRCSSGRLMSRRANLHLCPHWLDPEGTVPTPKERGAAYHG